MPSTRKTNKSSHLQPFNIEDDESVVDFLQRATWFDALQEALQKHSEFMQPWKDDYPTMEYAYPDFNGPGGGTSPPGTTDIDLNPANGVCVLSCFAPLYCSEDVECHFSISQTPTGMDPAEAASYWQLEAKETNLSVDPPLREELVSGDRISVVSHLSEMDLDEVIKSGLEPMERRTTPSAIYPLRIAAPSGGWPTWPDYDMTRLYVRAMDAAGNLCDTWLNVFCRITDCCNSTGYVAMTFDDGSTPDTIAPNSSITVYVSNGCGPYVWSVVGTGFGFTVSQTSTGSNTLTLANTACGAHAALARLTITDSCGTTLTPTIKASDGSWEGIASFGNDAGCDYSFCQCSVKTAHNEVYGNSGNGLYLYKFTGQKDCSCLGTCDSGCDSSTTLGAGSSCGGTTVSRTAAGVPSCPTCCWANGQLYYWTCGDDCS